MRLGGTEHHHWHRRCAEELLLPELRQVEAGPGRRVHAGASSKRAAGVRPGSAAASVRRDPASARALYARIGRTYVSWARALLPLAAVVFVPLGLIHAIPVHAHLDSIDVDSGLEVARR